MQNRKLIYILLAFIFAFPATTNAQFRKEAFSQSYVDKNDTTAIRDSSDKLFSFKEFFGGLAHKNEAKLGTVLAGSFILPGSAQIYNKDYWKLPIIYGGMITCAGLGGYYMNRYNKGPDASPKFRESDKLTGSLLLAGMGLFYWGSLMDGVACYKSDRKPHPGRATAYSILLPGLGQAYNGEYWKMPIYWGCLAGSAYFLATNNTNYKRFKRIHNEATDPNIQYTGPISGETALWYRNVYRRYRDYSIVALVGFYLLQVIDANVFAYMHDFEVSDDLSMSFEPTIIAPNNSYAMTGSAGCCGFGNGNGGTNSIGMTLGFRF